MGKSDNWSYIQTPKKIFDEIDKIIQSEEFQKLGFFKPKDIATELFRKFIKNPDELLDFTGPDKIRLLGVSNDKIILMDTVEGIIIVEIDEHNKLMCYSSEDNHNNKYVDFCLKNKRLWNFLEKRNVKIYKIRNNK